MSSAEIKHSGVKSREQIWQDKYISHIHSFMCCGTSLNHSSSDSFTSLAEIFSFLNKLLWQINLELSQYIVESTKKNMATGLQWNHKSESGTSWSQKFSPSPFFCEEWLVERHTWLPPQAVIAHQAFRWVPGSPNLPGELPVVQLSHAWLYYIPGTQMGPLVLVGKGLVLGGWTSKIEVIWVPGKNTYDWLIYKYFIVFHCFYITIKWSTCFITIGRTTWQDLVEVSLFAEVCQDIPSLLHQSVCSGKGSREVRLRTQCTKWIKLARVHLCVFVRVLCKTLKGCVSRNWWVQDRSHQRLQAFFLCLFSPVFVHMFLLTSSVQHVQRHEL